MPFFDANKMGITIDYDDNMCLVGGSLRGVVNIFVRETVTLCGASLRYRIVEGCALSKLKQAGDASVSPDCYAIEYVLFGARSTRQAPSVRVVPGHYSYPFAIPIPQYAPPTQRFGGTGDPSLLQLFGKDVAPYGGPCGPAVRIEHLVEVVVYVAHSWKDKHQSRHAPCVVSCTSPSLLQATNNGMEGHLRNGNSMVYPGKGFFSKLFNSGPVKSKEQADCDLFIYNTTVSLADSPFLHFAIRGVTNCPYRIELVRVVKYTPFVNEPQGVNRPSAANQTASSQAELQYQQRTSALSRPPIIDEQTISSTTMPPLNSPNDGVRGRLLISPFALEHSVSFKSRCISVSFYVTLSLQYLSNDSTSMIAPEYKMKIPVNIYTGTFEEASIAAVGEMVYAPPHQYAVTGAVMGYDGPPVGEQALYRPVAPVTDREVTHAVWSDPTNEPTLLRPTTLTAATNAANTNKNNNNVNNVNDTNAVNPAGTSNNANQSKNEIACKATMIEDDNTRPFNQPASLIAGGRDHQNPLVMDSASLMNRSSVVSTDRRSAHRRMYEHVAPTWVRAERSPAVDLESFEEIAEGEGHGSGSSPTVQSATLPQTPLKNVSTTTLI